MSSRPAAADDAFATFIQFLRDNGAEFGVNLDLGVDKASGLRSLLVQEAVPAGQDLFVVPPSAILTVEEATSQGAVWRKCSFDTNFELKHRDHTALALFLLENKATGSRWEPWYSLMPKDLSSIPAMYVEEDFREFQASPVAKQIKNEQKLVEQDFLQASKCDPQMQLEDFRKARAAIMSRQFNVHQYDNGEFIREMSMMVPLLDFVNHIPDGSIISNVRPEWTAETGVKFVATRDISPGEGLYSDYGTASNREVLRRWGFTVTSLIGTYLNDMPLYLDLKKIVQATDKLVEDKLELIDDNVKDEVVTLEADGTILHDLGAFTGSAADRLLGHLRFGIFEPDDADELNEHCISTVCSMVDLSTEKDAILQLDALLAEQQQAYSTTEEEDKALLEKGRDGFGRSSHFNALVVRLGEKNMLRNFRKVIKVVLSLFDLKPGQLAKQITKNIDGKGALWGGVDRYILGTVSKLVNAHYGINAGTANDGAHSEL